MDDRNVELEAGDQLRESRKKAFTEGVVAACLAIMVTVGIVILASLAGR